MKAAADIRAKDNQRRYVYSRDQKEDSSQLLSVPDSSSFFLKTADPGCYYANAEREISSGYRGAQHAAGF